MNWMIVDGHEDIATALLEERGRDFSQPAPPGRALSLADMKRGGVGVVLATVFATEGYWKGESPAQAAERQMACYEELLGRHAEDLFRIESRGDLSLCRPGGPIGMLHLMEGADPVAGPRDLARWVERGVRVVGLAWNTPNRYSGGTRDEKGVTEEGRRLLDEMRRLQVVPDMSHLNPNAFAGVLDHHPGVVVASHSNAHAIRPHRRNLTDDQIRRIADRKGLVGVVLFAPFLGEGEVTLDLVISHIDHMVSLVGADAVGIGSDLDGGFTTAQAPRGIETVADLRRIGESLSRRGYADRDIEKILGGNWIRVLRQSLPA
jgi:membrane dipeptidase